RRSAHRAGAAQRAGSGCCTSSRPFVRAVALHDHATARSTAVRAGAASPGGGPARRLSRARPSRPPPAPTRLSRTGSTIALTALEPLAPLRYLVIGSSNGFESPSVSPTAGSSSTPLFAAAPRGKKP